EAYCREAGRPLVVKADGLAAGKGVIVAKDGDEAAAGIERIMRERAFGDAGERVLIEETLVGPEVSYHVLCSGTDYVPLAAAQDHKRLGDGDAGPNTGGMGAYSPPPMVSAEIEAAIRSQVVEPTLKAMAERGTPFRGVLFIGLMVVDGAPQVLEYNVRFGDPECECLMARFEGNLAETLLAAAKGELASVDPQWGAPASLCVVLASEGYPGKYPKGRTITGVAEAEALEGVTVFQAGTRREDDALVTAGGRVLTVTATGADIEQAAERAYAGADRIHFEGRQLRRDIGWQAR
ncbi:MAG: phosphoribosylamine--glycine ligase, partial [Actinobacteria bacterium]|nr:phosphoribosylamine--glycine ligase [Actinomycetota bacterium]